MACVIHPNYTGLRLGAKAKACPMCVALYNEVKASGVKETRGRIPTSPKQLERLLDPAPIRPVPIPAPVAVSSVSPAPTILPDPVLPIAHKKLEAWEVKANKENEASQSKRALARADTEARENAQKIALQWFIDDSIHVKVKGLTGILQSEGNEESGRRVACVRIDGSCRWFDAKDVVRL